MFNFDRPKLTVSLHKRYAVATLRLGITSAFNLTPEIKPQNPRRENRLSVERTEARNTNVNLGEVLALLGSDALQDPRRAKTSYIYRGGNMKPRVYLDTTVKLRLTVRSGDRKMTDRGTEEL